LTTAPTTLRDLVLERLDKHTKPEDEWSALVLAALEGPTELDELAAAGVFPPVADTCTFCDYQSVCGPFREARAARKSGDPRLAAFKRLREIA